MVSNGLNIAFRDRLSHCDGEKQVFLGMSYDGMSYDGMSYDDLPTGLEW